MKIKRAVSSYILLVGVLALIMVGGMVSYQIYASLTKSQITKEQKKDIKPLDGSIEALLVKNLEGRRRFLAVELNSLTTLSRQLESDEVASESGLAATASAALESNNENLNE
ncbi:hypothetical protein HY333_01465 [Candidatus Collierbacteria bacterium]|nr:hypothetical protein [Candidatus Collierbacteria bacterium]